MNFSVFEFVGQFSIVFEFELNSLIAVFEFVLDSLIILLSKLIHLDQFKWRSFCLPQEPKKKNTVHVDIRQKNWDNYKDFRSLTRFKSKHVVLLGPIKQTSCSILCATSSIIKLFLLLPVLRYSGLDLFCQTSSWRLENKLLIDRAFVYCENL